jgi:hypothetical protein
MIAMVGDGGAVKVVLCLVMVTGVHCVYERRREHDDPLTF